jgi:hypothetical protein
MSKDLRSSVCSPHCPPVLPPSPPGQARRAMGWTGGAATKPAHAGTTSAPGSPATPRSPWSTSKWRLP